ncbi:MAG: hypothetical protein F4045_07930 [Chloroflexi bacterium]|nr:hypothetical protein [Chloroflexota bacterium]MYB84234.1 hypothetical protein [Chloroflexota bacterium]MYK35023.1 hypothetical protein [Chloroflexota bacterium]
MRALGLLLVAGVLLLAAGWMFRHSRNISGATKFILVAGGTVLAGVALAFLIGAVIESVRSF